MNISFSNLTSRIFNAEKKNPSSIPNDSNENDLIKTESNNTPTTQKLQENDNMMDHDEEISENGEKITENLAQVMTKIIPDADVQCSNIILIGAQSCGKTKLIISMVFHYLVDNPLFTHEMGDKLLRLFRTGKNMVTRRPMEINFKKSISCNISLQLGKEKSDFNESSFDEIIEFIHKESVRQDGRAFQEKVTVTISASNLPNLQFTDLPGLITEDRKLSDADGFTIRALVEQYVRSSNTTIIAVEPALNEEFATSQVVPLIRRLEKDGCPHIFSRTVLVLSKCDKVREGLEQPILRRIELSADALDYPFQHVVGVINKIEPENTTTMDMEPSSEIPGSFSEFRKMFRDTKLHEKCRFSAYRNQRGVACCTSTQCTTAAVFHHIELITFQQMHQSMLQGLQSLAGKVKATKDAICSDSAPPLSYYDHVSGGGGGGESSECHSGRAVFIYDLRAVLKELVSEKFKSLSLFSGDTSLNTFLDCNNIHWPCRFSFKDCEIYQMQAKAMNAIDRLVCTFIDRRVYTAVLHILEDSKMGCFASIHSCFHRIERFPSLIEALKRNLCSLLSQCCETTKTAVQTYLTHWKFEVSRGKVGIDCLPAMLQHLESIALGEFYLNLCELLQDQTLDQLVEDDGLMEESSDFADARNRLRVRWEDLRSQHTILQCCYDVQDNNALRGVLEAASAALPSTEHGIGDKEWLQFWHDAEHSATRSVATSHDTPQSVLMDEGVSDNSLSGPAMSTEKFRTHQEASPSKHEGKSASSQRLSSMMPCHSASLVTPSPAQQLHLLQGNSSSSSSSSSHNLVQNSSAAIYASCSSADSAFLTCTGTRSALFRAQGSSSCSSTADSALPGGTGTRSALFRVQDSSSCSSSSDSALPGGVGTKHEPSLRQHKRSSDCLSHSTAASITKRTAQYVDLTMESDEEESSG